MRIVKEFEFEANHHLPNHRGKCANQHGHSYRALINIEGRMADPTTQDSNAGMVVDFYDISEKWKEDLEPLLDHQNLNETLPVPVTTAECIAAWIFSEFDYWAAVLQVGYRRGSPTSWYVHSVTVYETRTGCAIASYEDMLGLREILNESNSLWTRT